ncbi:MAG: KpsF/GutQ family sugar-phosphate isomerase [Pseudomonadales bacterium]|nr:KpsF/GutQ family sugar-phosphate isomerase [Pseudomonadales bacterium]
MASESSITQSAIRTIEIENKAVAALLDRIDHNFTQACNALLKCRGRVVVLGIGKSGHIGKKIAATLASTGTPALFVHPAEASHGDIGMIAKQDIVLALSNSGNTDEITALLPVLKRKDISLIAMTGDANSPLANAASIVLDSSVAEEACPLGLAPTSSTTAALVLGDALAMAPLEARGFTRDDFAVSHPGGNIGRRLLVKVEDLMHRGSEIPQVREGTPLSEALIEMSSKGFGLTTITDSSGGIVGVFTDGDLRRSLDQGKDIQSTTIDEVMSRDYKHIQGNALAVEAAKIMQDSNVYVVIVKDTEHQLQGILKMHDLLQANVL